MKTWSKLNVIKNISLVNDGAAIQCGTVEELKINGKNQHEYAFINLKV